MGSGNLETLRTWAYMLCCASVLGGFAVFLVPEGGMKKSVNIVLSLVMLSIIVYPVTGDKVFSLDLPNEPDDEKIIAEEYSDELNEYIITSGESVIKDEIELCLDEICAYDYEAQIDMSIENGEARLESVKIIISSGDASSIVLIKKKIGSLTGVVPEVETK